MVPYEVGRAHELTEPGAVSSRRAWLTVPLLTAALVLLLGAVIFGLAS